MATIASTTGTATRSERKSERLLMSSFLRARGLSDRAEGRWSRLPARRDFAADRRQKRATLRPHQGERKMRNEAGLALLASLCLGLTSPGVPAPTREEIAQFREAGPSGRSYESAPLVQWEEALLAALAHMTPDQAADALAPRFEIERGQMRDLVRLYIRTRERGTTDEAEAALRRQLRDLAAGRGRSLLVLQATAESLDQLNQCAAEDFAALMSGSAQPAADAWAIANASPCGANFVRAATLDPARAMPALIRLAEFGSLGARDALPLYAWLTRPEQLARIAEPERPAATAWLVRHHARLLFETGLTDRAVALLDGLPQEQRALALTRSAAVQAVIDGLPIVLPAETQGRDLAADLAAAYAVSGRAAEAEALFGQLDLATARRAFDCTWQGSAESVPAGCRNLPYEQRIDQVVDILLIDQFLHKQADDPYPLAEAAFARSHSLAASGPIADLRCRVFADPRFADICRAAQAGPVYAAIVTPSDAPEQAQLRSALASLDLPGLGDVRAEIEQALARVAAANPETLRDADDAPRISQAAPPTPFRELVLPERYRSANSGPASDSGGAAVPRGVAGLPRGFLPVRFERSGRRAVAISVSQTYDPTGE